MNPLTPYNIHTGGTLSNGIIRDAQTNDVPVFNTTDSAWHNEPSTSLDVTVKSTGTGLFTSGLGDSASPLIFQPIQISTDKAASGATLPITSVHGFGTTASPLYYQWTGMTQPGDMLYWSSDTAGPDVVSTGGPTAVGQVLTVNTSGLPEFILPNSELFNAYVFPDATHGSVSAVSGVWTPLNGTNGTPVFPYQTGNLIAANTLKFTAPSPGSYRLVGNVTVQPASAGTFGNSNVTLGFDYNNSGNPQSNGAITAYVLPQGGSAPNVTLQVVWERPFNLNDTAQLYIWQNSSSNINCNCNWMSAVKN